MRELGLEPRPNVSYPRGLASLAGLGSRRFAVIDVGTSRTDAGLKGDVDFATVSEVAGAITPVPGGVGPMTIACLLQNTLKAATLVEASRS